MTIEASKPSRNETARPFHLIDGSDWTKRNKVRELRSKMRTKKTYAYVACGVLRTSELRV